MRLNHNRIPGENQDSKLHCATVCTPDWAGRFPDRPVLRTIANAVYVRRNIVNLVPQSPEFMD